MEAKASKHASKRVHVRARVRVCVRGRDAAQPRRPTSQQTSPWSAGPPAYLLLKCAPATEEGSGSRGQRSPSSPPSEGPAARVRARAGLRLNEEPSGQGVQSGQVSRAKDITSTRSASASDRTTWPRAPASLTASVR